MAWVEKNIVVLTIMIYLVPTVVATLTYPGFYEDEPWVFLAAMEFTRGNGLSLGTLGEGQSPMLVFGLLMSPLIWLSPFDANITIRILAAIFSVYVLWVSSLIAAKMGPTRVSCLAPAAISSLPIIYITLRYGRPEVFALALGLTAIYFALSHHFSIAGLFSALAVCIHPILIWIGLPCILAALSTRSTQNSLKYIAGGGAGLVPQFLWNAFIAPNLDKYMVSSSITSSRFAVLESLINEPERYVAYVSTLTPSMITVHVIVIALAVAGIAQTSGWMRWMAASIVMGPLLSLALFSYMKNPYYFVGALPAIGLVAALGTSKFPRNLTLALTMAALGYMVITHLPAAWESRSIPTVTAVNDELAKILPQDAIVFAPMREAGLILDRPDLNIYSYHTLAPADSWDMPACSVVDERIKSIYETDRRHDKKTDSMPIDAYLVMYGMSWPDYLALIYGPESKEKLKCLWDSVDIEITTTQFCYPGGCEVLDIRRRRLH